MVLGISNTFLWYNSDIHLQQLQSILTFTVGFFECNSSHAVVCCISICMKCNEHNVILFGPSRVDL